MPKKSYVDQYIKEKAKRKETVDYEAINRAFKKCKYCGRLFHPAGLPKHEAFCSENKNRKSHYENTRMWKCEWCGAMFDNHKVKKIHENRCVSNPNHRIGVEFDQFDKLRIIKQDFPKLFNSLTEKQLKRYLEDDDDMSFL